MKVCPHCKARFIGETERCPLDNTPLTDLPDPLLGRTIGGRYRVVRRLGGGGMGTVYLARHDLVQRDVALKILAPELAIDPTQKERFLREARAANRVKHPNIIDISDFGEEHGCVYLVMELLEGESLASRTTRGPIPPREATSLLVQIASALARAHELEVVHRDIKADNIFLCPAPGGGTQVKVLDFGLAHLTGESRLTMSGAVFGTPEYMAPEQAQGMPCTPASDLYSLGVMFFEMLTGQLPFRGTMAELIVKHMRAPAPSARALVPALPPEADAVVARLMEKDPQRRYRSAFHLIEDLEKLLKSLPEERPAPPSAPARAVRDVSPGHQAVPVQTWRERRNVLRVAVAAAYPGGPAPAWVTAALAELEDHIERAPEIERALSTLARDLATAETRANELRERIGRALDELSRDQDAATRDLERLERALAESAAEADAAGALAVRAWDEAAAAVGATGLTPAAAERVEAAGLAAARWRAALSARAQAQQDRAARRQAFEDLGFQVSQLKGRLGAINAETDQEQGEAKRRIAALGGELAEAHGALERVASGLVAHLAEFPAARPLVAPRRGPGAS